MMRASVGALTSRILAASAVPKASTKLRARSEISAGGLCLSTQTTGHRFACAVESEQG